MFDLGVTGGDRSARWRRMSTTVTRWIGRNEDVMGADQDNHDAVRPQASGHPTEGYPAVDQPPVPSRRQVLRVAGAGLGAAALAPVLGAGERPADAARARLTARAAANRVTDFGQGW